MTQLITTIPNKSNVFQKLLDKEASLASTAESPVTVNQDMNGLVTVDIHGSLYKKLIQYANLKGISIDEAKSDFAGMIVPVLGKKVRIERRAKLIASSGLSASPPGFSKSFTIKVNNNDNLDEVGSEVEDSGSSAQRNLVSETKEEHQKGIDYTASQEITQITTVDSASHKLVVFPPTIWGANSTTARALRFESHLQRRASEKAISKMMSKSNTAGHGNSSEGQVTIPEPSGIQRTDDHYVTLEQFDVQIDARLKKQGDEMRIIFEDVLKKQTRNLGFSLRLFEGKFFSPQFGEDEDSAEAGWTATLWAGVKGGVRLSVKTLVSVAVSTALLASMSYIGNTVFPSSVPSPTTLVSNVGKLFKASELKAEYGAEGFKVVVEKGKTEDADTIEREVERLMTSIGGDGVPIAKQKTFVQYLQAKTGEAFTDNKPLLVPLAVVDAVEKHVKDNEKKAVLIAARKLIPGNSGNESSVILDSKDGLAKAVRSSGGPSYMEP